MRKGLSGIIHHGQGLLTTYKRNNEKRLIKRRKILPGYPITKKFETKEEIDKYMGGDRIVCLLCGRSFIALGNHVVLIHGMTADQYKIEYGLPLSVGLDNKDYKEIKSNRFKKMIQEGVIQNDKKELEHYRKLGQQSAKFARRQPFRKKICVENLNKHTAIQKNINKELKLFDDHDYEKVLVLSVEQQKHPFDVCKENKGILPSSSMVRAYKKQNKDYNDKFINVINNLPFPIQAQHQSLGNRFIQEVRHLTEKGLTNDEMANLLQINKQTIINTKSKYKFKAPINEFCHRGHKYEKDNRKCKECALINRRNKGVLPRHIAAQIEKEKTCASCGIQIIAKRIGRPFCNQCRKKGYYASQQKYKEANRERRREMARIAYAKRKGLIVD